MVYLEPVHLGWEPLIATWAESMAEQIPHPFMGKVLDTIRTLATLMLPLIRKECKEMVPSVDANVIQSMLNLLTIFLGEQGVLDLHKAAALSNPEKAMMTYVAFSLIWSLGANVHDSSRGKFGENFKLQIRKKFPEFPDGDVYEFGIDKDLHRLEPWDNQKPDF
jgi:dynein heavy chain